MSKGLPIVYLEINPDATDEETGMYRTSFVTSPATETVWTKFSNDVSQFEKNEMKRIVTGPIMLAETEIYRTSPIIGEYFVKFSEDTIFQMMTKYFEQNKIHNINEQHDENRIVDDVFMVESFIIGDRVSSELYPNLPKGTWMASFYIKDESYWNETIMGNEFSGFSLEGFFTESYEDQMIDDIYNELENILNSDLSDEEKEQKIIDLLNIEEVQ
jgi:hypothetical protein